MCGRYTTNTEEELIEIKEILNDIAVRITSEDKNSLNKEVSPGKKAPIITKEKEIRVLKWGFVKWDNKGLIFNARSEGINESNYFHKYTNNRCVIPASHYFEWEHKDKEKIKYMITETNKSIMLFAGIVKIEDDGSESYCILTKNVQKEIEFIHNRMPLILTTNQLEAWLDGKISPQDINNNIDLVYEKQENTKK